MHKVNQLPQNIDIGYIGEQLFRPIEIDMTPWMGIMPNGVPSIVHTRPGEGDDDAYIVATTFENNVLTWTVSASDLGTEEGVGIAQVWLEEEENNTLNKRGMSAVFATIIHGSVGNQDPVVPPSQLPWLQQMTALKTATVVAAEEAQAAQEAAEDAQEAAEAAQGDAEAAQEAAETAQGAAETAQAAAETSEENSEAWAVGQRGGADVGSSDPTYHNNSKYYAGQAADSASTASSASTAASGAKDDAVSAKNAAVSAKNDAVTAKNDAVTAKNAAVSAQGAAESWATGGSSGTPGASNNAKYYSEQAASSATTASTKAGEASGSATTASNKAGEAATSATSAETQALKAEGFAVGEQNGTDVGSGSPYYHNNAEYYAGQASDSATTATTQAGNASGSATTAGNKALVAEGFANGEQNGTPVSSGSDYYQNNAKYFSEQAADSATAAAGSADDAADSAAEAEAIATMVASVFDVEVANPAGSYVTKDGVLYYLPDGHEEDETWANTTKEETKVGTELAGVKSAIGDYASTNDARFLFSENLFNSAEAFNNYYVSNTNGNLIAYNGWFATPFMPVDDSANYSFIIRESGQDWKKPNGVYYAFYDSGYSFTHGGVSSAGGDLATQNGDAYCRASYYSGAINSSMFGTTTNMSEYIGTRLEVSPYYVAPKYNSDPYKGLVCAFVGVSNPYYSLRVSGNRISVNQDGAIEGAFIKFDSIVMIAENGFKTKSWEDFKTDIQNDAYINITNAYDGTPDVLRLLPKYGIIYDYKTNTYHVKNKVYITGLTQHDMVVFYNDENSVPGGAFYDAWVGNHKQGIEKYIRTIESGETGLLNYGSKFVFAFATDCHWYFDNTAYHNYTNEMIEELRKCIGFDCYINGGDSIYYGTKFKLNGVAAMNDAFAVNHDNYVYCIGNHDYNGVSGETQNSGWMFDADGIESLCMRKMQSIVRPSGARYYYRDFEEKKIRVIVLDTSDVDITFDGNGDLTSEDPLTTFVVRQNQIDWLCDALDCPDSGWGVVIVMHVGLYLAEDGFTDNNPLTNSQAIIDILKAYVNKGAYTYSTTGTYAVSGNGTFANADGSLVGVWSGHAHADGYCNKDGFNAIQTECGYPDSASRAVGTIDEICVDCVCVDMTAKKVTLKRFGSGSDREYTFI